MSTGSLQMKDSIGPVAIGTGTSFQLTPSLLLQIFGILIAIWGGWYALARFLESERANDLNEERLRWEQEIHAKMKTYTPANQASDKIKKAAKRIYKQEP